MQTISNAKTAVKSVIFDIDGTLIDSVDLHARAWQESFKHFGFDVSFQSVRDQIGKGGDELLPTFLSHEEIEKVGEALKSWRGNHFKANYLNLVKPFPESNALLGSIKESGKRLAAGSSAHRDELDVYIELLEAKNLFDVITCSDDAEKSKPHPDIFEAALGKLGDSAPEVIVVGDAPYDAEAAAKIEIISIGFLSGGFPRAWLVQAGAKEIYDGPGHLLRDLNRSCIMCAGADA